MRAGKKLWTAAAVLWGAAVCGMLAARGIAGFAQWYSVTLYPVWVGTIGRLTGCLPFSLVEFLLYALIILAVVFLIRGIAAAVRKKRTLLSVLGGWLRTAVFVLGLLAFLYVFFCGINYSRRSFAEESGLSVSSVSADELEQLCRDLADEINRDAQLIGTAPEDSEVFAETREAMKQTAETFSCLEGYYPLAKDVLISRILTVQGVTGVYSPFTIEANVNREMPKFSLPYTAAHELSHLRGFMREDESNFIGWFACSQSDSAWLRYSGNLMAWISAGNALYEARPDAWRELYLSLCERAREDLTENNTFWELYKEPVSDAQDQINDAYLKAHGQTEGIKSYGRMVDLMIAWRRSR